jgi:hypothetical protein
MDDRGEQLNPLLPMFLDLALRGDYESIMQLPGAGVHRQVLRLCDGGLPLAVEYFQSLKPTDQAELLKAVAIFENTVGGVGSVTLLERFASLKSLRRDDCRREAYGWILENTDSYRYYSDDTKSLAGYESWMRHIAQVTHENMRRDELRQSEDKKRIAESATGNLFNAVRRGDLKAVAALLKAGAAPSACCPDGTTIIDFARGKGHLLIAALLDETLATEAHK